MSVDDCQHPRRSPVSYGLAPDGGPRYTVTIARERLERSWTTCLDCGLRLERAAAVVGVSSA